MGIAFLNRSRQVRAAFLKIVVTSDVRDHLNILGGAPRTVLSITDSSLHPETHSCLLGVVLESIADTGVPRSQAPFTREILRVALRGDLSVRQAH